MRRRRPGATRATAGARGSASADRAFLIAVVLAAAILRTWRLDHMSLWSDEGLSMYRATKDLPFLLSGRIDVGLVPTQDVQPPLYFLALGAFLRGVGASVWAARAFSGLAALPTVPLVWALGRRLAGPGAARVASVLAAASPVYLWYSQEVRGYTLLVTLGALSTYALVRTLGLGDRGQGGARWAVAAAATSALMVWVHYLGFFLLAFQLAVAVAVVAGAAVRRAKDPSGRRPGPRHGRRLRAAGWRWGGMALAAAAAATLPLVPFAVARLGLGPERDQHFVPLAVMVQDVVRGFSLGLTVDWDRLAWAQVPLAAAAALGAVAVARRRRTSAAALVGWLALPPLGLFALTTIKPVYMGVRHILVSSPPWYILLGAASEAAARRGGWGKGAAALGLSALVVAMAASDVAFYRDGSYAKDDLRGMVSYVERRAVPGDALVLSDAVLVKVVDVYGSGIPVTAVPLPGDPRPVAVQLAGLAAAHDRLWFMTPGPEAEAWLADHTTLVDRQSFPGRTIPVRVEAWEVPVAMDDLGAAAGDPVGAPGADGPGALGPLELVGWRPRPRPAVAGAVVRVHVALRPVSAPGDVHLAVGLIDASGDEYGRGDQEPFHGHRRASLWPPGRVVVPPLDLFVSPAAPPGTYRVTLAVYDPESEVRWPAAGYVVLGDVQVVAPPVPPPPGAVPAPARREAVGGGWRIIGFDAPAGEWPAGEERRLRLWLRREGTEAEATTLEAILWGAGGEARREVPLPRGLGPGALRRVDVGLAAPGEAGAYRLGVALRGPEGRPARLWARQPLGWPTRRLTLVSGVPVAAVPRVDDVPAGVTAAALRFGELASLVGYELEGGGRRVAEEGLVPGEALTVTLYWRAAAHTPRPNHVSVQLLPPVGAADPRPVAQHDGPPAGGGRPTTGWRPGEVVTDSHRLVVPPDLAPGEYPLAVVVYDPGPGGARLPVNGQPGAAGTLAVLTVVGDG